MNNINHKLQIYAKVVDENEEENKDKNGCPLFFVLKKVKFDK